MVRVQEAHLEGMRVEKQEKERRREGKEGDYNQGMDLPPSESEEEEGEEEA